MSIDVSKNESYFDNRTRLLVLLGVMFLLAFALRLHLITTPPLGYASIRQMHSSTIARWIYYQSEDSISDSRKELARLNSELQPTAEPPLMEHLAVLGYRMAGAERLWIPRVYSVVFWMVGGIFFFLIAKKISSVDAAVLAVAYYLFLPFAVLASRSFQPDPLMTVLMLVSVFFILRHDEKRSFFRLLCAGLCSGLAMLIMPKCQTFTFGAFFALSLYRKGIVRSLFSRDAIVFVVLAVAPAIFYYSYITGIATGQSSAFLNPTHIFTFKYWKGWTHAICYSLGLLEHSRYLIFGALSFAAALMGVFTFRSGVSKTIIYGLWFGYITFGLIFQYHIHTHFYYQLQLIPLVALSLGSLTVFLVRWYSLRSNNFSIVYKKTISAVLGAFLLLSIVGSFKAIRTLDYNEHIVGEINKVVKIGEILDHSSKTISLADAYGFPLRFFGEVGGPGWPYAFDIRQQKQSAQGFDEEELLQEFLKAGIEYFIISSLGEYQQQDWLKENLPQRYAVLARGERFIIFDLRSRIDSEKIIND